MISSTTSTYQYENADPHLIHDARVYMMCSSHSSRLVKFHLRSFMLNHSCFDGQNANMIGSDIHPATRKWQTQAEESRYCICSLWNNLSLVKRWWVTLHHRHHPKWYLDIKAILHILWIPGCWITTCGFSFRQVKSSFVDVISPEKKESLAI